MRKDKSREGINWYTDDKGWCFDKVHVTGYKPDELHMLNHLPPEKAEDKVLKDLGDYGTALKCGYGVYGITIVYEVSTDEYEVVLTVGKSCD